MIAFPFKGKGLFINNLRLQSIDKWIEKCKAAGASWVAIKVDKWEHNDLYVSYGNAFRAAGIGVVAWQYVYADNPTVRANQALRDIARLGAVAFFVDAEGPFNKKGMGPTARTYMNILVPALHAKGIPVGLCSYRFPSLQPNFPWVEFGTGIDFHAPQVYWVGSHNPGQQLKASVLELRELVGVPFIPAGASYSEKSKTASGVSFVFRATPAEIQEFLVTAKQIGCPAAIMWYADEVFSEKWWEFRGSSVPLRQAWLSTIAGFDWEGVAISPPPLPPAGALYQVIITATVLNVRKGPGSTFSVVGTVVKDTPCWVFQESPGWCRIETDRWVSSAYVKKV